MDTTSSKFELPFVRYEQLTKDTFTFYFDRIKRGSLEKFDFSAGQYIRITLPIENPDERGTSRYFTISSSPTDLEYLTITTKIIQSSFKLKFKSLVENERVSFFGPLGSMFVSENDQDGIVFLAGGIGITPAHSMLRYIDSKKININFTLIVSFSFKDEVIFYEELKQIESRNLTVKVIYSLTKEENLYSEFEKGRINEEMIKKYTQESLSSKYFIAGPPGMNEKMSKLASDMGIPTEKIVIENFTGY